MKRVEGIRAVTYDCWATLLKDRDPEGAMESRIDALLSYLKISRDEARRCLEDAWLKHDEAWKQVETFGPGRMAAYCLESRGIFEDTVIAEVTQKFEEASLRAGVVAVEGARAALETLRESGIPRGLICDTGFTPGRVVRRLLDQNGLLEYLDFQCFSDEVGVPKPGNEIFLKALAELGMRPPEVVHVGDLKRTDIAGARDVGMHAVRFRGVHNDRTDAPEAETVVDTHGDLLEVIGIKG